MFIGALIGYAIYRWKGDALAIPVAMVAAILPDLVDKPLGHILLQGTLDNGRIFAHGLLFLGMVAAASLVLWKWRGPLGAALVAGVVSHLVLDGMWDNPTTLFWPLLGPFTRDHYPDYFGNAVITELTAPSEYVFLLGIVIIAAAVWGDRLGPKLKAASDALIRNRRVIYAVLWIVAMVQVVIAAIALLDGPEGAQNEVVLAAVLVIGSMLLPRLDPGGSGERSAAGE